MTEKKYNGVQLHGRKYSAHFKFRDTNWRFGSYDNPEHAAWVVDFCKYILLGLNPAQWHHSVAKPNFPIGYREDFPRVIAMNQMLDHYLLCVKDLEERIAEYDKIANRGVSSPLSPIPS